MKTQNLIITIASEMNTLNRLVSLLRRKMYKIDSLKVSGLLNSVNAKVELEMNLDSNQDIQLVINQLKKIIGVKEIVID